MTSTLSNMPHEEWRDHYSGGQSKAFMADMWPTISRFLQKNLNRRGAGRALPWRILDVGCATGHGTALLGSILMHGVHRAEVTGLDLDKALIDGATTQFPWCEFIHQPNGVEDCRLLYDLVISSHTIEHVLDPLAFLRKCQSLAIYGMILYAPYREEASNLVPGHLHSFGPDDLVAFGAFKRAEGVEIIEPIKWGGPAFILELPGKAGDNG